jgi:photosystem II stability/assembly factor-like uncharacterized protein
VINYAILIIGYHTILWGARESFSVHHAKGDLTMKTRAFAIKVIVPVSCISLLFLFSKIEHASSQISLLPADVQDIPQVTGVEPDTAPNDLTTTITITGTGFAEGPPETLVSLGDTALEQVTWLSDTELQASVPWGMDPGDYTLTVQNPDGEAGSLPAAFTVTQGIGTWQTGGPYGGWIYSLKLGDSEGQIVYATVSGVGLFRSRDGGASWKLIFIEIGHINELAVDPGNPNRLYIFKQFSEVPTLYRSGDGGDSWTAMPEPLPGISARRFLAFVSPHDSRVYGGLFDWVLNPSCEWGCGLFRFDEADQEWDRLGKSGLLDENTGVTAVGFDPINSNIIYAGLVGGKVVESTDGGQSWSEHSDAPIDYIKELVVNPVGGELWVCGPGGMTIGGLYRYTGGHWILMYDGSSTPSDNISVRNMIFDPGAVSQETQHIWIATGENGVLKSEDGGQNWVLINPDRSETIALNPLNPLTIYSGSNEGVTKTTEGGVPWQPINEGLAGIVPKNLGASPHDPAVVYGVADSIGIFGSLNGGQTWERLTVSTGGPIVVDPVNPKHVVNADYDSLWITDDGWIFNRQVPIPMPPDMAREDYLIVPTAMIARPDLWVMGVGYNSWLVPYWNYDGGGGIYLSDDGEDWNLVTNPLLSCPPTSLGFDPVDPNVIYGITSGYYGGALCEVIFLKSTDSGQTWVDSAKDLVLEGTGVIAVEPTPPYRVFLTSNRDTYTSIDQGATWSKVNSFPAIHINLLLFLPGSPSVLYAGTYEGLYRSVDGAQTWQRASGVLGELEIWSMAGTADEDRHILYAATVGGAVDSDVLQTGSLVEGEEALVNAGVYRFTNTLWGYQMYLPDVMR